MGNDVEYIDYSVFLGMNARSEAIRRRCKGFLADRLEATVHMTWDHVGRCDDLIWGFSRELQDLYYPFMDALHSQRCLEREGYQDSTLRLATTDPRLQHLPVLPRLLVARALERQAVVYSVDPALLERAELPVRSPPARSHEPAFPEWLERLYQGALALRVPLFDQGAF